MLYKDRKELRSGLISSPLGRSLAFLHREYAPQFFFWEVVVMVQKLLFVGMLSQFEPGTFTQAIVGLVGVTFGFALVAIAKPYKRTGDGVVANVCAFSLVCVMIGALACHS